MRRAADRLQAGATGDIIVVLAAILRYNLFDRS
jgi:hypothetical protein